MPGAFATTVQNLATRQVDPLTGKSRKAALRRKSLPGRLNKDQIQAVQELSGRKNPTELWNLSTGPTDQRTTGSLFRTPVGSKLKRTRWPFGLGGDALEVIPTPPKGTPVPHVGAQDLQRALPGVPANQGSAVDILGKPVSLGAVRKPGFAKKFIRDNPNVVPTRGGFPATQAQGPISAAARSKLLKFWRWRRAAPSFGLPIAAGLYDVYNHPSQDPSINNPVAPSATQ